MSKIKCFQGTSLQNEFESKISQGIEESQSIKEVITEQANKIIDKVNRLRAELELPLLDKLKINKENLYKTNTIKDDLSGGVLKVQEIAQEYKEYKKIQSVNHPKVTSLFKNVSTLISKEYESAEKYSNSIEVKKSYDAMIAETISQYNYITSKGLKVEKFIGKGEPYKNSKDMLSDLSNNSTLKFLPNEEAFGSNVTKREDNIGLQTSGIKLSDGYEMTNSEVFRVVHDYFGHGILGNQFGAIGEENATLQHLDLYSDIAAPAVIFQTRGQNSWVNFSGKNTKASELRIEARELKKQGKEKKAETKLGEADKLFIFAEPKIGIFKNKFNFKKYDTARRLEEQQEIDRTRNQYSDSEISKALPIISKESVGRRGIDRDSSRISSGLQSVKGIEELVIDNTIKAGIQKAFPAVKIFPRVFEIKDGKYYKKLQEKGIKNNKFRDSVTIHTVEEYNNMRMFITEDGTTGITITKNGHLGGAFSDKINGRPNDLAQLMVVGIKEGATNAEAFATVLPDYYSAFGFKAVSRAQFNEEFAPENWNYSLYKKWQEGKPDLVHFIYDGGSRDTIEERLGQFDYYENYQKEETPLFDKNSYEDSWKTMEMAVVDRYSYENKQEVVELREEVETLIDKTLFEKMQEFKRMPEMKIEGKTLTTVNQNDLRVQLEQTLKLSDDLSISSDIIYLNELSQDLYDENIQDVKQLIKEIEVKAAKQGVDIAGLSDKVFSNSRDEIYDLLESLNTLLLEPSEQYFNDFIRQHKLVFETELKPITKVEIISENNLNKSLILLKTKLSEYTLFNEFGLLKVSENIYQRVEKEDLDTLYNKLYDISQYNENILPLKAFPLAIKDEAVNLESLRNIENRDLVIADIKRFIENEVSKLDVPSVSLDNTTLQQLVINKYAFEHPLNFTQTVEVQEEYNSFEAFDGNEEYLKTDFISDFYVEYLQEKIKNSEKYKEFYSNFSINEGGITLVNDDAITVQKIKDYLADKNIKQSKDLENYSLLTDQIPNLKTTERISSDYTRDFYRVTYSNNPMTLNKVEGDYKFLSNTTILKNNSIENFIRIKDRLFELVDTKGSNSFYEEIPVNTSEYKTFSISQPILSVNIDNYGAERLDESKAVNTEKYYSKKEEEKINEESFDCL